MSGSFVSFISFTKIPILSASTVDPDQMFRSNSSGFACLFVLRFYGPVNPMGSCRARSVYLATRLLGRLSPLSG